MVLLNLIIGQVTIFEKCPYPCQPPKTDVLNWKLIISNIVILKSGTIQGYTELASSNNAYKGKGI